MKKISLSAAVSLLLYLATPTVAPAQTFTTLYYFNGSNGADPSGNLVQATDGNFYGTTGGGGINNNYGTIFRITPAGRLTTLHSFDSTDGSFPYAGLIQGTDGNFYGTTVWGGTNCQPPGCGTVFRITPAGRMTTLYNFTGFDDGSGPYGGLIQAYGNFYGTTEPGGTVFKITPAGMLTTLYSFCSQQGCTNGENLLGGLVQDTHDGSLYGTTFGGVNTDFGTVFKISPRSGTLTTLHNFTGADGADPAAGLIQGTDGNFYGTTLAGGANGHGTVFQITPAGTLTTLHSFNRTDGSQPDAGLIQGTDGNFYGTTYMGGANNFGTVFQITLAGTLTTLHSFAGIDGGNPIAAPIQGTDGKFYGTNRFHGHHGNGTVFSLDMGLGPFVQTLPILGRTGRGVKILGNNLTGATSVTFNDIAASFTVLSATEIQTSVPSGATTGPVEVTTPSATLSSNIPFTVPQ